MSKFKKKKIDKIPPAINNTERNEDKENGSFNEKKLSNFEDCNKEIRVSVKQPFLIK
jgi:hypothetical protein